MQVVEKKKKTAAFDPIADAIGQISHWKKIPDNYLVSESDKLIEHSLEDIKEVIKREWQVRAIPALRQVTEIDARKEIIHYLGTHGPAYPSDIADALRVHYDVVNKIMLDLVKEGLIEEKKEE